MCKYKMLTLQMILVINHYVWVAFLFVQTVSDKMLDIIRNDLKKE